MGFFMSYIRSRLRAAVLFSVCCVIFAVCFIFYRLPVAAVLYPAALSAIVLAAFAAYDFGKTLSRHRYLMTQNEISAGSPELLDESLPCADTEDEDYKRIVLTLKDNCVKLANISAARLAEMTEYYTLWTHQIKTPISAMRLYLQYEDTELARRLRAELRKIETYVEMALVFRQLESGNTDYVIKEHDLNEITRQAVKKFSGEFIMRRIKLIYEPFEAKAVTDEKWLSFVIEQIISNALKYTASGSITIRYEPPCGLVIQDTGIGIAPEDIPRIFEKGYTGCNGREDKKASGIGLYLCKRICANLGASISASSEAGKGTSVRIELPHYENVTKP